MLPILLLFLQLVSGELQSCSEPVEKLQLCSLVDNYGISFPSQPSSWPSQINNSISLLDIVEFEPTDNTIGLFVILKVWWEDPWLSLKSNDPSESLGWYYIDQSISQSLFFPKLKIKNAKSSSSQIGYSPSKTHYYWYAHPHYLEYQETLKVVIYCSFEFSNFPFDQHTCDFNFGASSNADYNTRLAPSIVKENSQSVDFESGKFQCSTKSTKS